MKKDLTPEEYLNRVMTTPVKDGCPMRKTLELLSGKWRTHIIYELSKSRPAVSANLNVPFRKSQTLC